VMLWVCIASASLALLGFAFSRASEEIIIFIGILYGGFVFTLYGLSVAHVNDLIDQSRLLEVTGGLLLLHGIGAAIGPTFAGIIMDLLNPESLMLFFAVVLGTLSIFTILRISAAPAVPESEKSGYVVMTGIAPAVMQVDTSASSSVVDEKVGEEKVGD